MSDSVTITQAAKELNKSPSTVRGWIQKGCPCIRPGEVGRNKGAMLNLSDVIAWRNGGIAKASHDDRLQFIAKVLMDCLRRDKIHYRLGTDITERQLAGLLALVYERYHKNLLHEPPERGTLPDEIANLLAIWVQ